MVSPYEVGVLLKHLLPTIIYFYVVSFVALFTNRRNPFLVLIILELQLLLILFLFVIFSCINGSVIGLVVALFIVAFAGAEASVGISILIVFYRLRGVLSANSFGSSKI